MSAPIKTFDVLMQLTEAMATTVKCVLHTDHLASHAFDEEKERALFEADMVAEGYDVRKEPDLAGVYVGPVVHTMWQGWKRCARSRAKAAGCL